MNWEALYLFCFLIGFGLSAAAFLAGALHMPHFHGHAHHPGVKIAKSGVSKFNFATFAAFLAWFGGTGYLLERYSAIWVYLGLLISGVAGLAGATVVFWFLKKLNEREKPLDPADYEMVGVFGTIASPIRAGGTGELIYQRDGSRKASPARSEDGAAIARQTEVIVTRYEKGIAYVRSFEEMSK
jgi:membrane protein implicated in regulation of membrane protease activity